MVYGRHTGFLLSLSYSYLVEPCYSILSAEPWSFEDFSESGGLGQLYSPRSGAPLIRLG
jgi:hypothetical protein